jgi:glycosyltransferase involved in cell wall biosynthesis
LNILIYTQCFAPKLGGIESVMTNIATQSSKLEHNVSVLADGSKSNSLSFDNQQNFEIKRFDQIKFFRNKIKSSFANDLLKNKNFDLIFFDSWKSLEHFNNITQIKKVCLIHGNEILNLKKKERIIKSLKKVDKILFNSNFTKKLFYKQLPELNDLPSTVIFPAFIENINYIDDKKKYDLCTIARLEYRKGHHLVLGALTKLKKEKNLILTYAILGDGPELSKLKDLVVKNNLLHQVDFINNTNSSNVYKQSKIHVMPTITTPDSIEGFGISNVEAASYGLPSIVSSSGGTPESIDQNGYIVNENDIDELSNKISLTLEKYPELSEKSLIFAKNFENNIKIKEYLNCLAY